MKDLSTSLKNQIYAELIRKGIEYPPGILGSFKGIKWVEEQLPEPRVRRRLALLKILVKELDEYNRELLLPAYDENKDAQILATVARPVHADACLRVQNLPVALFTSSCLGIGPWNELAH